MAVDLLPTKVTVSEVCLFHKLLSGFRDGGCVSILWVLFCPTKTVGNPELCKFSPGCRIHGGSAEECASSVSRSLLIHSKLSL